MEISVQIFTGSFSEKADNWSQESIVQKLNLLYKTTQIKNAIIGWNTRPETEKIIALLKEKGTAVYLWFPVFSELDAADDFSYIIGHDNKPLSVKYVGNSNEDFKFYCPGSPANIKKIIEIFENHYAGDAYDGIFLDKIRFPSFIGGLSSVLGCFCDSCMERYNLSAVRDYFSENREQLASCPFDYNGYSGMSYGFKNPAYQQLFDYKKQVITDSVTQLASYFKNRGYKTGLDLFSPFLSHFVGQDYQRLLPLADMVKPMFYRATNAPAGLPFEIEMYSSSFNNSAAARKGLAKLLGTDFDTTKINTNFINNEIRDIKQIVTDNQLDTQILGGIEFNYNPEIAPVTKDYILQNLQELRGLDGIVMSWDLNSTPLENIEYLCQFLQAEG